MKKIHYSWQDVKNQTQEILRQLHNDDWRPDYIVGITRGGAVPAVMISQYLEIPMRPLEVSLRDGGQCVSDCGMAEDAFGYVPQDCIDHTAAVHGGKSDPAFQKNILIVDDINDSGATINWIKKDWAGSCLPSHPVWNEVWGNNVRFATLIDNAASDALVEYRAVEIDKVKDPCWIVFPWEEWWAK